MIRTAIAITLGLTSVCAMAQMSPVGVWNTVDEKTKEIKSENAISESGGAQSGKITKL